jgi:16S rRNA (guanine527-N7)-methyltransferase
MGGPHGPPIVVGEPTVTLLEVLGRSRSLGFLGPGPVEDHLDHARGFVAALETVQGRVVDLGSGGGVPGLIVAEARPDLEVILVDATAKRCRFLEGAVATLGLRARVVEGRAEDVGRGELRGAVDAVVARSFGRPAPTAECAAPLLRVGGLLVVSEPPDGDDRWPAGPLRALGLVPGARTTRSPVLQVLDQVAACPAEYPRRDGVPAKRPLF